MKIISAILACLFFLTGCVAPMTKNEVAAASYQQLPSDYQEKIKQYFESRLKDPDSAKYRFSEPRKAFTEATRHFAYVVPVAVNAKNSYGGYTGFKMYYLSYYGSDFKDVTTGVNFEHVKWSDDVK
ncbi:hypothetical protein H2Y56_21960 [Pectobacterium aroidearum]|uniref:Lipoprotein n=1 Tax=Pectobacterium aroidearum TaxID=1201031 RepID=A0ABR5ZJQ2_9GAMM|nr:hypothetical protein [Pectobacterium aroidearum]MBA5234749.1 hypothetical protein [Pectobacterium aroidearum]MBA5739928.1 hypothetical protein [Pectobacterium aroidearum]